MNAAPNREMDRDRTIAQRLQWWLDQGAEIVCGGSHGEPRVPLKLNGAHDGAFTRDFHRSVGTIPTTSAVMSYGIRFTETTPQVLLDVDVKRCDPFSGSSRFSGVVGR